MNGFFNVLKPPGMTSFDVVAYLKKLLNTGEKIGHAGTLDPGAAGVLPICIGNATKVVNYIMDMKKIYRAELTLGVSTDTQDSFGNVVEKRDIDYDDISIENIRKVMDNFIGEIEQIPPMYSAIRIDGKRLYELAREGKLIERKPRKVYIYSIDIVCFNKDKILFDVVCSKGTYVRTLCSDIGDALGCGGHMSFLIRKKTGIFELDNSYTLEQIAGAAKNGKIKELIIPVEEALKDYGSFYLSNKNERKFKNGNYIEYEISDKSKEHNEEGKILKVFDNNKQFIGLGEIIHKGDKSFIKPKKLLN
ncbi:MAG TPA: tRNA pseudouridine(55) synthase TruB [Clostridiaceae bacterium]|nr:tRNA pseudouridine(55) synthase TruB [Clostridiaceae bacterium]